MHKNPGHAILYFYFLCFASNLFPQELDRITADVWCPSDAARAGDGQLGFLVLSSPSRLNYLLYEGAGTANTPSADSASFLSPGWPPVDGLGSIMASANSTAVHSPSASSPQSPPTSSSNSNSPYKAYISWQREVGRPVPSLRGLLTNPLFGRNTPSESGIASRLVSFFSSSRTFMGNYDVVLDVVIWNTNVRLSTGRAFTPAQSPCAGFLSRLEAHGTLPPTGGLSLMAETTS